MTDSIVHRGPDDAGRAVADGVALGARRLSIIDVAGGHQPIANESGRVHAVLNGEIYNYLELRQQLERHGHRFRTRSDTETIVHAYEEAGPSFATELRGMFAIAVWDERRRRLVLARDRIGKKPLYYAHYEGRLVFGSEIKALLAADPNLAEANEESLIPYLSLGLVAEAETMYRRIRKLPAAHQLTYENGQVRIRPYWSLDFGAGEEPGDADAVVEELRTLLDEAVRIRLMSEVPLGVFLSGGLDSSTIVALAQDASAAPLKTFTMGFDRPEADESADAKRVADHCGTDHHAIRLHERDLAADLPDTVLALTRAFDEPFVDSSALPTYFISKLAREHVTVILSGDGGDELFAGYSAYRGYEFATRYQRLPPSLQRAAASAAATGARLLPPGHRYEAQRVARILRTSSLPFEDLYYAKNALCDPRRLALILNRDFFANADWERLSRPPFLAAAFASDWPDLTKASYADLRFRLVEDMLVKVDRMSMAHSLEVRSPLLDHRLVEFVFKLPPSFKLRGGTSKAILRRAVSPYLPRETMRKAKQGFEIPLRSWLRGELREMTWDYLVAGGSLVPEIFDRKGVSRLLTEHAEGQADHSAVIWALLSYATWEHAYLKPPARAPAVA